MHDASARPALTQVGQAAAADVRARKKIERTQGGASMTLLKTLYENRTR
jgi:hypothetical protein